VENGARNEGENAGGYEQVVEEGLEVVVWHTKA
jgi:hypothetical protein